MAAFRTLDALNPAGKRVVLRSDLNVPAKDGKVTDTTRIDRSAATIKELADKGGRVIVITHFGRPKGREAKYSQKLLVEPLAKALGKPVVWADDVIGPDAEKAVAALKDGQVLLTENIRFHAGEEGNDAEFAKALAKLGDVYVNDAFATAHRAHASTATIAKYLPAYAGRLMQAELEALGKALDQPVRPVIAIVGGSKISTKLDLLGNLLGKVDTLVIGGGMANTFLFAQGVAVGASLCEKDMADTAREIMNKAKTSGKTILLPEDAVVAAKLEAGVASKTVAINAVPADQMILDVGPATVKAVNAALETARTLVWNGPVGAFETAPFDMATTATAKAAAQLTKAGKLLTVAGGGDTVSALAHAGVDSDFSYISTAGGAFLEWLEGKELPGVAALRG
ncbi:MAG TPA: phosphoglycerate kinase [Magnetospirillaceae bacterium]|jgi:phosphoglycerate kinase